MLTGRRDHTAPTEDARSRREKREREELKRSRERVEIKRQKKEKLREKIGITPSPVSHSATLADKMCERAQMEERVRMEEDLHLKEDLRISHKVIEMEEDDCVLPPHPGEELYYALEKKFTSKRVFYFRAQKITIHRPMGGAVEVKARVVFTPFTNYYLGIQGLRKLHGTNPRLFKRLQEET